MEGRGPEDPGGPRKDALDNWFGQSDWEALNADPSARDSDVDADYGEARAQHVSAQPTDASRATLPQSTGEASGLGAPSAVVASAPSRSNQPGSMNIVKMQQMRARHREAQARYRQKHKVSTRTVYVHIVQCSCRRECACTS